MSTLTPPLPPTAEALSPQDLAILEAVREAVEAASRRLAAQRAGLERDADLWTARLQAAAARLSRAALGL